MSRQMRAHPVVSQPPRFSISSPVGAAQPQPRLLHGVVGLADRAEHPVGHRAQARAVFLKLPGEAVRVEFVRVRRARPGAERPSNQ